MTELSRSIREELGTTLLAYGLVAVLISVVSIVAIAARTAAVPLG